MDEPKNMEDMAIDLYTTHCFKSIHKARKCTTVLVKLGYGDVEQAINKFVKELIKRAGIEDETYGKNVAISYTELDELVKEFYGKGEG